MRIPRVSSIGLRSRRAPRGDVVVFAVLVLGLLVIGPDWPWWNSSQQITTIPNHLGIGTRIMDNTLLFQSTQEIDEPTSPPQQLFTDNNNNKHNPANDNNQCSTWNPEHHDTHRGVKYFMYQPSGGWGNQRYIIQWALVAANAMNRTLLVAPIAPHSDIWHGYNEFLQSQLVPACEILDVDALHHTSPTGVEFLDDAPSRVVQRIGNAGLTIKTWIKGHYKYVSGKKKWWWLHEDEITSEWANVKEDVVFWDRMSMWKCCGTTHPGDYVWYLRHIMFNNRIKRLAKAVIPVTTAYNAIHVRRGDHTSTDRKTAEQYYKWHKLDEFDKTLPLYIATDEPDKTWFNYLTQRTKNGGGFKQLLFSTHLNDTLLNEFIHDFPEIMHGDLLGFVEQLICANAQNWEGSYRSTFSAVIYTMRKVPSLRSEKTDSWWWQQRPSARSSLPGGETQQKDDDGDDGDGENEMDEGNDN